MSLGERIKSVRKTLNLTQDVFATRLGLKQNSIAQIESDRRAPSDQTILSICREFGVNETWLRTGAGSMTAEKTRAQEMSALVKSLMADRPESFRSSLVTALLRFDPDGPEWEVLKRIYDSVAAEYEAGKAASDPAPPSGEPPDSEK